MAADDTLYTELQNAGSVTVTPASDWQVTSCGDGVSVPITDWIHPAAMKDPESFMAAMRRPDGRRDTLALGIEPEIPVTAKMIAAGEATIREVTYAMDGISGPEVEIWRDAASQVYRAMAAIAPVDQFALANYRQALMERELWAGKYQEACTFANSKDREIIILRAERDLWKGLHGDLVAKFSAAVPIPEPKSAPEHDPFRDFRGEPWRMGR